MERLIDDKHHIESKFSTSVALHDKIKERIAHLDATKSLHANQLEATSTSSSHFSKTSKVAVAYEKNLLRLVSVDLVDESASATEFMELIKRE